LAGAAGFEPAITGSKPVALPLGYAPISADSPVDAPRGSVNDRNISPMAIEPQAANRRPSWGISGDIDKRGTGRRPRLAAGIDQSIPDDRCSIRLACHRLQAIKKFCHLFYADAMQELAARRNAHVGPNVALVETVNTLDLDRTLRAQRPRPMPLIPVCHSTVYSHRP
jgi:hypothetical protein